MINFKFGRGKKVREKTFDERLFKIIEDSINDLRLSSYGTYWDSTGPSGTSGSNGIDYDTDTYSPYNKRVHQNLKMKNYVKNNINRNRNNSMLRGSRNVRGNTNSRSRH